MLRPITTLAYALGFSALTLTATHSLAQEIDPGLWEMHNEMQGGPYASQSAEIAAMLKQLESAPPQVRAMLEQQLGISGMNAGKDGGMSMKMRLCLAPEDISSDLIEEGRQEGDCTFTKVSRSGKVWKGTMVCQGEEINGTGDFVATLHNRGHYTTEAVLNSKEMGKMKMRVDSKRLGADCGDVRPGNLFGGVKN